MLDRYRDILACSARPKELEGDAIYVVREPGFRGVEVVSNLPFNYKDFSSDRGSPMEISWVTNLVGGSGGWWRVPYDTVMWTLREKNNVRIVD